LRFYGPLGVGRTSSVIERIGTIWRPFSNLQTVAKVQNRLKTQRRTQNISLKSLSVTAK
jgi:hypothetical protein